MHGEALRAGLRIFASMLISSTGVVMKFELLYIDSNLTVDLNYDIV